MLNILKSSLELIKTGFYNFNYKKYSEHLINIYDYDIIV